MKFTIRKTDNHQVIESLDCLEFYGCEPIDFDTAICYLAYNEGNIAAYLTANELTGGLFYLSRVAVLEPFRGHSLQDKMQRRLELDLRTSGAMGIVTYTLIGNAASANNMIKSGYKMYVPEYAWVGHDVNYWRKEL